MKYNDLTLRTQFALDEAITNALLDAGVDPEPALVQALASAAVSPFDWADGMENFDTSDLLGDVEYDPYEEYQKGRKGAFSEAADYIESRRSETDQPKRIYDALTRLAETVRRGHFGDQDASITLTNDSN